MEQQSIDFEFILHQLQSDDPRLRQALVETWYPFVRSIAYSQIGDPDQADYAVFETFKDAWHSLDRFRTGSDFMVWLARIAVRVTDRYQKGGKSPTAVMELPDSARLLREKLNSLPSRLRYLPVLYLVHDLSVTQIGEILRRRADTVYGQLEAGLNQLTSTAETAHPLPAVGMHRTTRRALLYPDSLGLAAVEEAEAHLRDCPDCQDFRKQVLREKSLFRSVFGGGIAENQDKGRLILDLLAVDAAGGLRQTRFGKLGREVAWVGAAILVFLALGAIFNRINPLTEVKLAVAQQNASEPASEVVEEIAEVTLSIAPAEELAAVDVPVEPEYSWDPDISADGRWIVFNSSISDLVRGDQNRTSDIFVLNRLTGNVERVSLNSQGLEGNGSSIEPEISQDGRFVVFTSWADNLVEGDDRICTTWGISSSCPDIFLHDRQTDETILVSRTSDGVPGADFSISPRISSDGATIVYWSAAGDLTGDDYRDCQGLSGSPRQTSCLDLFIYNRVEGTTRRLMIGRDPLSHFERPYDESLSLSGDGRWLVTAIQARDRIAKTLALANSPELYLFNLETLEATLLNAAPDGSPGDAPSYHASLSRDSRYIVFSSKASNLVQGDSNNRVDVFLLDRGTGDVVRLSTQPDGSESSSHSGVIEPDSGWMGNGLAISGDGNWILFASSARDLVSEPNDSCAFTQACQYLYLTRRTGGDTRQLNLTSLNFQPFLSMTEFGEYNLFMAVSSDCNPGVFCGEINLYDRLAGESALLEGAEAPADSPILPVGAAKDSHNLWLHSNWVTSVLFSPDGSKVTSASLDGSIHLTSIDDETVAATIVGDGRGISRIAYSPAGDHLAAVSRYGDVLIWKMPEGSLISLLPDLPGVKDVAFSPDGASLALGGEEGVWIWNLDDGLVEDRLEVEKGDISALRYSSNGRLLAAANEDFTVWIWNLAKGGPAYRLGAHTGKVNELEFSPDGRLLASASNDGAVNLWQVDQGGEDDLVIRLLYTFEHGNWVSSIDFSPDGERLAAGTFASQVVIWDLTAPRLIGIAFDQTQNQVLSVVFSPDGSDLAAGTVQGEVHYWQDLSFDTD